MTSPTVAAFVADRYLAELQLRDPAHREQRRAILDKHLWPRFGEHRIREVPAREMKAFIRARLDARIPVATVKAIADEPGALFRFARRRCYRGPLPLQFLLSVRGLVWEYRDEIERHGLDVARAELLHQHVIPTLGKKAVAEVGPGDMRQLVRQKIAAGLAAPRGRGLVALFEFDREAHLYRDVVPTAFLLREPWPGALPGAVVDGVIVNAARAREASRAVAR